LAERPRVVVGSKADVSSADWDGPRLSAATRDGVQPIVYQLADLVREARATQPEPAAFAVHRPMAESFRVERGDDGFVVVGRDAERAVALNDLTNFDALQVVHDRLKRLGVDRALARAGAQAGDKVRIGGMEFEYED
jgi:GTP-binding protein